MEARTEYRFMFAAVTTASALLLVDLATREVLPIEQGRTEYYGISWFPDSQSLVLSHSGLDNTALVDLESYALSETGTLSHGAVTTAQFLSQPHQILCASDGRVVCTNTGRNAITVVDLDRPGCLQEVRLSEAKWDRFAGPAVGDHLNSVFERDGELHVIAHRFDRGSLVAVFSYPEMEIRSITPVEGRTGLHNIWLTEDGLTITCDSGHGALLDLSTQQVLWECGRSATYTRGLAASGETVLVGESESTARDGRRASGGAVWVLDRSRWTAIDYIPLGPYGEVREVRLLDVVDEAHHGVPFAGLEALRLVDERDIVTRERLAMAGAARCASTLWQGFTLVFGRGLPTGNGWRIAADDEVCLALEQISPTPQRLEFDYSMSTESSHVAFVIGYDGGGADRNMVALLLQSSTSGTSVSVFRHGGTEWTQEETVTLPPDAGPKGAGTLRLDRTEVGASVAVDGTTALEVAADRLPAGPIGIRWLGAMVRPVGSGSNR
jgi:hypothetical protein